jgi:hypothetical protein
LPFAYPAKSSDEEAEPSCKDMIEPHPPNLSLAQPKYTCLIPAETKPNLSKLKNPKQENSLADE